MRKIVRQNLIYEKRKVVETSSSTQYGSLQKRTKKIFW